MKTNKLELIQQLAYAWNNLGLSELADHLADDIVYESQWVLQPIQGRAELLQYLSGKFDTLRKLKGQPEGNVVANLAYLDAATTDPCLVVSQSTNNGKREMLVTIQERNNKIHRIDLCAVPSSSVVYHKLPEY
ncbi:hypothetical protein [Phnomibacter sp. MR]|uniref:hypothetical protein n=1 Tax=Phnomibacter sp. MR TaxID=3042318 RepID=UPI003A808D5A